MKNFKSILSAFVLSALLLTACGEDDSVEPTPPPATNGGKTTTDTTSKPVGDQFWINNDTVKCTPYSKNFTQFINLLSVNTDKCYLEFVRPNFTFDFQNSISPSTYKFSVGTYNLVPAGTSPLANDDVIFTMSGYNSKQYVGVSGIIEISKLATDTTIWVAEWDKIKLYSETDSSDHTFTGRLENF